MTERSRHEELGRLGIKGPLVPERYAQPLGVARASQLERQVEDRLMELAYSPPGRAELSAQARQLGAAGRALNIGLAQRVVELEDQQAVLVDESVEADQQADELFNTLELLGEGDEHEPIRANAEARSAEANALRQSLSAVTQQLETLSKRDDHPDRWLAQHGKSFTDALAAGYRFRHEHELANTTPEQATQQADSRQTTHDLDRLEPTVGERAREGPDAREVSDVGLDPF